MISLPSPLNVLLFPSNVIVTIKCFPNDPFWCPASISSSSVVHFRCKWVFCGFSPWCQLMYCNDKEEGKSHDSLSFLLLCTEQCLKHFTERTRKLTPLFVLDFCIAIAMLGGDFRGLIFNVFSNSKNLSLWILWNYCNNFTSCLKFQIFAIVITPANEKCPLKCHKYFKCVFMLCLKSCTSFS